ncbi:hypothetical protein [Paraglaciecola sp. T6c]|uniref:hypothetical protein n=1 Tax=Pseudoalteromonas atlantica (strain T6c / ATCC BAA-1087) TaxID=3042615 RepID=UPI0002E49FC0|nr:hypothetical protein [Paraglaciecola sp. T6c]
MLQVQQAFLHVSLSINYGSKRLLMEKKFMPGIALYVGNVLMQGIGDIWLN